MSITKGTWFGAGIDHSSANCIPSTMGAMPHPIHTAIRRTLRPAPLALVWLFSIWCAGCHLNSGPPVEHDGPDSLGLTSTSLGDGQFPTVLTCDGVNTSPALGWNPPPAGTKSLALILNDPHFPPGSFVHWVLFNLPSQSRSLPASLPIQPELPDGTRQGTNDFGKIGYAGPCPHRTHHYVFTLFALDGMVNLPSGATRPQLDDAMRGHVLARGTLVARYTRQGP